MTEPRRYPRYSVYWKMYLETEDMRRNAKVLEVGLGGLCFRASNSLVQILPEGAEVTMRVRIPCELGRRVPVRGIVRWAARSEKHQAHAVGVQVWDEDRSIWKAGLTCGSVLPNISPDEETAALGTLSETIRLLNSIAESTDAPTALLRATAMRREQAEIASEDPIYRGTSDNMIRLGTPQELTVVDKLKRVRGVGDLMAATLLEAGILSLEELASLDPKTLRRRTGLDIRRAQRISDAARALLARNAG